MSIVKALWKLQGLVEGEVETAPYVATFGRAALSAPVIHQKYQKHKFFSESTKPWQDFVVVKAPTLAMNLSFSSGG